MRQTLIHYAIGFTFCVITSYYAITRLEAYAVIIVPVWGALLAKPLLELTIVTVQYLKNRPLKPYQGIFYAFNNRQVRVFEINGTLWVDDEDVLPFIGLQATATARRHAKLHQHRVIRGVENEVVWVYSQQAILAIVNHSVHKDSIKLKRWLEREVYLPHGNKA